MKTETVNKDYFIIEERYEGTPSHTGVINVKLPLTNDISQIHWGQYIGTKTKEDAIKNAELITTALNACKEINKDNPLNVAKAIPELFEALRRLYGDINSFQSNYPSEIKNILKAATKQ